MKEILTDEELDALIERVRGDKGKIYHQYFLGLREAKRSRRVIKKLEDELEELKWRMEGLEK